MKKNNHFYYVIKRFSDVIISLTVLIAAFLPLSILSFIIAFETRTWPIYTQTRIGQYGKPIKIYKLRSMVKDSDNVTQYFTPQQLEEWKRERKVENDPRITRSGKFIRETSLDEFPQFFNVLRGDLSIIGPRPIVKDELVHYGKNTKEFLSCKPGITGWWQATARNDATYNDGHRQELELFYVRNASLLLDIRIFFKTAQSIFQRTGK
ncbi:MAG: sugar transferase [Actinomycetaceae bacterium]|nr:sugar transferase [Actinomycetaceae bacterium]